jgi:hypothetical protein
MALTPEQITKAWTDKEYFYKLSPQEQAQVVKGGVSGGFTPQNVANAQAAAGVTPAIPPDNGEFRQDTQSGIIKLKPAISNSATNALRYPKEMSIEDKTDYVSFQFFRYNPPFGKSEYKSRLDFSSVLQNNAYDFYNSSGVNSTVEKQVPSNLSPVILYMPEDIQSQYGANWGGAEFNTAAVAMARTFGTQAGGPGITFSAGKGLAKSKLYDETLKAINTLTGSNISLDQFMGSVSGTILNPNTEMLYQGTTLRTFSLSFKMTPKDITEAREIKKICNTFKKAMLPSLGGQTLFGESVSLLKIPDICQVTFMQGNSRHEYLPVYKLCAIAGVDVNYTADGAYATYEGGSPVSTKLTISFKEMKILFQNDIDDKEGLSY